MGCARHHDMGMGLRMGDGEVVVGTCHMYSLRCAVKNYSRSVLHPPHTPFSILALLPVKLRSTSR